MREEALKTKYQHLVEKGFSHAACLIFTGELTIRRQESDPSKHLATR